MNLLKVQNRQLLILNWCRYQQKICSLHKVYTIALLSLSATLDCWKNLHQSCQTNYTFWDQTFRATSLPEVQFYHLMLTSFICNAVYFTCVSNGWVGTMCIMRGKARWHTAANAQTNLPSSVLITVFVWRTMHYSRYQQRFDKKFSDLNLYKVSRGKFSVFVVEWSDEDFMICWKSLQTQCNHESVQNSTFSFFNI